MKIIFGNDMADTAMVNGPFIGTTTNPLRTPPEISNSGLMGTLTAGSFAYAPGGPGLNTIEFKDHEVMTNQWSMDDSTAQTDAFNNLIDAMADSVVICELFSDGTVTAVVPSS